MAQVVKKTDHANGYTLAFFCPGCKSPHCLNETWQFNGDLEHPTISPSILVTYPDHVKITYRCHSFIRNGRIEFLSDCSHDLAGTTINLPDITTNPYFK